jgi:hypothetical protein
MPSGTSSAARDAEIQRIKKTILEHREADAKIKELRDNTRDLKKTI